MKYAYDSVNLYVNHVLSEKKIVLQHRKFINGREKKKEKISNEIGNKKFEIFVLAEMISYDMPNELQDKFDMNERRKKHIQRRKIDHFFSPLLHVNNSILLISIAYYIQ